MTNNEDHGSSAAPARSTEQGAQLKGYEFREDRHGHLYVTREPYPWRMVRIDRLIRETRQELERREGICGFSRAKYQRAWDRQPELHEQHERLLRVWGQEREYQKRMTDKALARERRRRRTEFLREDRRRFEQSKCPACGHHTLAQAA